MGTALIIGANGFVGPWLSQELSSAGYSVYAADVQSKASPRLICNGYQRTDILDATSLSNLLSDTMPEQIYNLAAVSSVAQSWRMPALTMRINVEGAINLLEACRKMTTLPKLLLVGSSEEYESSAEPLSEHSPLSANNPYGISKMAQERLASIYYREYGIPVYLVRAFNHTGPGQADSFVLSSWCKQVATIDRAGVSGTLKVGNLDVARDFTDVRDVTHAYRLLMESDFAGDVFNVGSGIAHPLRNLLETILSLSEQDIAVRTDTALVRPCDNPIVLGNAQKARDMLGWEPRHNLCDTLEEMYREYRNQPS